MKRRARETDEEAEARLARERQSSFLERLLDRPVYAEDVCDGEPWLDKWARIKERDIETARRG